MPSSGSSAPAAPDPIATSNAQTQSNKDTASYNFGLSNPNVYTPLGSSTFSVGNTNPTYDYDAFNKATAAYAASQGSSQNNGDVPLGAYNLGANGQWSPGEQYANSGGGSAPTLDQFKTSNGGNPQVSQNISLNPGQQQLLDQQTAQSIGLSNLANQLQGRVGASLNAPSTSYANLQDAAKQGQDAYYKQEASYLDPQFQTQQNQLDSQLTNQGIMRGSDAWNTAEDAQNRNRTFAYNSATQNAITSGTQYAQGLFGLQTAARDQPLTEFNALRSGSQPQMPQVAGVNPVAANPTDVAGNIWKAYQGQSNVYNQGVASQNATTGGLFGLAGSGLGAYGTYAGLAAA